MEFSTTCRRDPQISSPWANLPYVPSLLSEAAFPSLPVTLKRYHAPDCPPFMVHAPFPPAPTAGVRFFPPLVYIIACPSDAASAWFTLTFTSSSKVWLFQVRLYPIPFREVFTTPLYNNIVSAALPAYMRPWYTLPFLTDYQLAATTSLPNTSRVSLRPLHSSPQHAIPRCSEHCTLRLPDVILLYFTAKSLTRFTGSRPAAADFFPPCHPYTAPFPCNGQRHLDGRGTAIFSTHHLRTYY